MEKLVLDYKYDSLIKAYDFIKNTFLANKESAYNFVMNDGLLQCCKQDNLDIDILYKIKGKRADSIRTFITDTSKTAKEQKVELNIEENAEEAQAFFKDFLSVFTKTALYIVGKTFIRTVLRSDDKDADEIIEDLSEYTEEDLNSIFNAATSMQVESGEKALNYLQILLDCYVNYKNNNKVNEVDIVKKVIAKNKDIIDKNIKNIVDIIVPMYKACLESLEKPVGVLAVENDSLLRCYRYKKLTKEERALEDLAAPGRLEKVNAKAKKTAETLYDLLGEKLPLKNWCGTGANSTMISFANRELCVPLFHALHIAGYYYEYKDGNSVKLKKLTKDNVEEKVTEELNYFIKDYISDMLCLFNESEKTELLEGTNPKVKRQFQAKLTHFVIGYRNFIVLRQSIDTGVLWVQYSFKNIDEENKLVNVDENLAGTFSKLAGLTANNNTSDDLGVDELFDALMSLGSNAKVIVSGADKKLDNVYSSIIVTDEEKYTTYPSFAYKPIFNYLEQGEEFSLAKILVGKDLENNDIFLNFTDSTLAGAKIFADSRSGKGVMTLSLLAALIAGGNPVIYGDYKPDMALLFNNVAKDLGKALGQETRFLACEFNREYSPTEYWYRVGKFDYEAHWRKATVQNGIDKFFAKWHIEDDTVKQAWLGQNNVFGVIAYCKFMLLALLAGETFNSEGKRFIYVADELDNYVGDFHKTKECLSKRLAAMQEHCKTLKNNAKKTPLTAEDKQYIDDTDWCQMFMTFYIGATGSDGKYANNAKSEIANAFTSVAKAKTGKSFYIAIGQAIANHLNPKGNTFTSTPDTLWTHNIIAQASSVTIHGNWPNKADLDAVVNIIGKEDFNNNANIHKAISNSYVHQGTTGTAGFFMIKSGNMVDLCKTYLILNENNYEKSKGITGQPKGYVGDLLSRFPKRETKAEIVESYICPEGEINPYVGYAPLLIEMARNCENFIENFNKGYDIVFDYLSDTPIGKKFGYKNPFDYIYDFHPDSIPIVIQAITAGAEIETNAEDVLNKEEKIFNFSFDEDDDDKTVEEMESNVSEMEDKIAEADGFIDEQEASKEETLTQLYDAEVEVETKKAEGESVSAELDIAKQELKFAQGFSNIVADNTEIPQEVIDALIGQDMTGVPTTKEEISKGNTESESKTIVADKFVEKLQENAECEDVSDEIMDASDTIIEGMNNGTYSEESVAEVADFLNGVKEKLDKVEEKESELKQVEVETEYAEQKVKDLDKAYQEQQAKIDELRRKAEEQRKKTEELREKAQEKKQKGDKVVIDEDTEDVVPTTANGYYKGGDNDINATSDSDIVFDKELAVTKGQLRQINYLLEDINDETLSSRDRVNCRLELVDMVSDIIFASIEEQFGGFSRIKKIVIDKAGRMEIDDIAFAPKFPKPFIEALPKQYQAKIIKGNIAEFFLFNKLNKFSGLEELIIEDIDLAERRVRREVGLGNRDWLAFKKKLRLYYLEIGGEEITDDTMDSYSNNGFMGFSIKDKLANLFGGSSKEDKYNKVFSGYKGENTIMGSILGCTPVKALATATAWTLGAKTVMFAASAFGPLGLFFGAVATAAAVKSVMDKKKERESESTQRRSSGGGSGRTRNSGKKQKADAIDEED